MKKELIEMPNLYESHIRLGKEAFYEKHIESAIEHFDVAYDLEDNLGANSWLVKSFVESKQLVKAYNILKEKEERYLEDEELFVIYFNLLLQLKYFHYLELVLNKVSKKVDKKPYVTQYQETIYYWEKVSNQELNERVESFMTLGEDSEGIQIRKIKSIRYLPESSLLKVAQVVLQDSSVSPFVRTHLLDALVQLQVKAEVFCLTYEHKKVLVIPSEVLGLNDAYEQSSVLNELVEELSQENPSLSQLVSETIKLHIGCLYPFSLDVMQPADLWKQSYLIKYSRITSRLTERDESKMSHIFDIQQLLDEEVMRLMSIQ